MSQLSGLFLRLRMNWWTDGWKTVKTRITLNNFLKDAQGKTFADVADVTNEPGQAFDEAIRFFSSVERQRRMEESEIHHDRPPLAGVVRELEAQPVINAFLTNGQVGAGRRFRQAVGVLVRMIMEQHGWQKTGRKGSLGVPAKQVAPQSTALNTGGLAFWFVRAERYERIDGMPFQSVREQSEEPKPAPSRRTKKGKA
jgi:hypothetical protein